MVHGRDEDPKPAEGADHTAEAGACGADLPDGSAAEREDPAGTEVHAAGALDESAPDGSVGASVDPAEERADTEEPAPPEGAAPLAEARRDPEPAHPLFFISAGLMLSGGLVIQSSSGPADVGGLFALTGSLLVYHCLLVGLGIVMLRRRIERESLQLFLLAAVFLVDPTFTWLRLGVFRPTAGALLGAGVALLGAGQLGAIWSLLLRYDPRRLAIPAVAYLAVLATGLAPGFTLAAMGSAEPGHLLDAWLLALVAGLLGPRLGHPSELRLAGLRVLQGRTVLLAIPLLGLGMRLVALHWIYDSPFGLALAAPLLLSGAWIAARRPGPVWRIAAACLALALVCVGVRPDMPGLPAGAWSAWRVVLTVAALLVAAETWRQRSVWLGLLGGLLFAAGRLLWEYVLPQDIVGWGAVGVGLAFASLALGAVLSLRRKGPRRAPQRLDSVTV